MSLPVAARPAWRGSEPRYVSAPERANWDTGAEAVELAALASLELDEWQASTLMLWLATETNGQWARFAAAIECVRQQGKGAILEARGLAGLYMLEERKIVYTAHLAKTCREMFERVVPLVQDTPALSKRVARIYSSTNDRRILLKSGASWEFYTRSDIAGRGMSGDCTMLDEAQELTAGEVASIVPTMLARNGVTVGGPQLIYAGSAGDEDSEKLSSVRDRAIAGDDTLTYINFAAGTAENHAGTGIDLDDEEEWRRANPAISSGRVTIEGLRSMRAELGDAEFAREHLGIWHVGEVVAAVDQDEWHRAKKPDAKPGPGARVFALDVPPEGKSATITAAAWADDGQTIHVEVVDIRPGTLWAVDRVAELLEKWSDHGAQLWLDPRGRAGAVLPDLVRKGIEPQLINAREYIAACEAFQQRLGAGMLQHTGQQEPLNAATVGARKRPIGKDGAWVWHRRDTAVDLSPLAAATIAMHGLLVAPPPPPKREPRKARAMFA